MKLIGCFLSRSSSVSVCGPVRRQSFRCFARVAREPDPSSLSCSQPFQMDGGRRGELPVTIRPPLPRLHVTAFRSVCSDVTGLAWS